MKISEKKIMVTGGSGFIGGRLIERLVLEQGAEIRALARNLSHTSRIARFPVEVIPGDVVDGRVISKAVEGCDIIFHCAYDFSGLPGHQKKVAIEGIENVCKAALKHKVKRLIYVSSFSVYGATPDGDLDEESRKQPSSDLYTRTKLAAEELVLDYHRRNNLPVVIIQPTIVYGPYSRAWTINPLKQLLSGQVVLPNEGLGLCNAVYIDDVIEAMFLASIKEAAVGNVFLISGPEPVTWKDFYSSLEKTLGRTATLPMSDAEFQQALKNNNGNDPESMITTIKSILKVFRDPETMNRIYQIPGVRKTSETLSAKSPGLYNFLVTKSIGRKPGDVLTMRKTTHPVLDQKMHFPDKVRCQLLRSGTRIRIDKARRLLAYEPKYDFKRGMRITSEFIKWANLA